MPMTGLLGQIRVVVADDEELIRDAVTLVLEADPRFTVAGVAASGEDAVEMVGRLRPHVVLLDVGMPGGGPDLCRQVLEAGSQLYRPVVVAVSASLQGSTVRAMLGAGASGYLGKGLLGDGLAELVARCAEGYVVIAVPQARSLLREMMDAAADAEA